MTGYILKKKIEPEMIEQAKHLMLDVNLKRSITGGARNLMSTIAELYYLDAMSWLPYVNDIDYPRTMDYDILLNGMKIDVKAKQRTVPPRPDYMASVVAYSKEIQKCDWYAFCQVNVTKTGEFTDFYYLGNISKKLYFKKSIYKRKGDYDGDNIVNGKTFVIREDCYNLSYNDLNLISPDNAKTFRQYGYETILWN